jgi:hypothetical protein
MHPSDAPACHACGAPPLYQWSRRASTAEAARQKVEIARLQGRELSDTEIAERYGPLCVAVTGCAEHHLGGDPAEPDSGMDRRALLHDADCAGHGACECGT